MSDLPGEIEVVVTVPEPEPEPEPETVPVIVVETASDETPAFDMGVAVGALRADVDALKLSMDRLDELEATVTALAVVAVAEGEDDQEPEPEPEPVDLSEIEFEDDTPPVKTHWYNRPMTEWFGHE